MNILTVSDAAKSYGATRALDGASFELRKGELLAIGSTSRSASLRRTACR